MDQRRTSLALLLLHSMILLKILCNNRNQIARRVDVDASSRKYFRGIVPANISDSPMSLNADPFTLISPREQSPHVFFVAECRNSPRGSLLVECVGFGRCLLFSHPSRLFFKTSKMVNLRQQKRLAASVAGVGKRKSEYASRPRQEV